MIRIMSKRIVVCGAFAFWMLGMLGHVGWSECHAKAAGLKSRSERPVEAEGKAAQLQKNLVAAKNQAGKGNMALRTAIEFIDPRTVEHTYFLDRRVTPAKKHENNPIIKDCHSAQTVLKDKDGKLRMWYLTRRKIPGHSGSKRAYTLRYAESDDGVNWTLPTLGLKEFDGSRKNNVVLTLNDTDANGKPIGDKDEGIWNFCVIDRESTPAPHTRGRYTALFGDGCFAWSDDGLSWTTYPENPVFEPSSDTFNNFIFDTRIGRYVLFHRPAVRIHAADWCQANRLVARIESDDLIHWDWSTARCVLDTDARDAPGFSQVKKARGRDLQFYGMTVTRHQDFYIGMAPLLNEITGRMDLRLVFSFDGIDWRREPDEKPFIAPTPDAWDCGSIGFVSAASPVPVGDDLYFYYGGTNMTHNYKIMNKEKTLKMSLGLGIVKRGRLVGYHAGKAKGELLTRPFVLDKPHLTLNADAANGEVLASLSNEDGTPIPGYSMGQFVPVRKDGLNIPLRWKGKNTLDDIVGRKVRLRLAAKNSALYAISTADAAP